MSFARGKFAFFISNRSGMKFPYRERIKEWNGSIVHKSEYEEKHPQLDPHRSVVDAEALRDARPDTKDINPVENLLVNVPTVLVPLYLTPVSNFQQGLWVISATIISVVSHMSSIYPDQPHVIHHKLRRYNFGAGGCYLMDKIMGTYKDH